MNRRQEQKIFSDFQRTCDPVVKDRIRKSLMVLFLPLVKFRAQRVFDKIGGKVSVDDLMQDGVFGLYEAIDHFDTTRNLKFATYAIPRIRGAIIDGLRNYDWVPRLVRTRSRKMDQVGEAIKLETGHPALDAQMQTRLGVTDETFAKFKRDGTAVACTCSIHDPLLDNGGRNVYLEDTLAGPQGDIEDCDRRDRMLRLLRGFNARERLIIVEYYYKDTTMKRIGEMLGVSESSISQVNATILQRLKSDPHKIDLLRETAA